MYLVYESNYGEIAWENDATYIKGLYNSLEEAIAVVKDMIEENKEYNYVLDNERNDIEEDHFVRMFYYEQENWDCYFEIIISKLEVK